MIVSIDDGRVIDHIPHRDVCNACISRLTDGELAAINSRLNETIEGSEIKTAGWMPGAH